MVQIYSGTQNEFDSGIEDHSENASTQRNSENLKKQLELQEQHENSDKQLKLQERYDFAIKEGFNTLEAEGLNPLGTIQNEALERSESSETSNDDGLSSGSSYEGDTSVVKADFTTGLTGLAGQPAAVINFTDCNDFHHGPKYDVVNNVTVNVVDKKLTPEGSLKSIEKGQKKFGAIAIIGVLVTLIVVVIMVVLGITQLQYNSSGGKPNYKPELPKDHSYDVDDHSGPGNISWVSRANCVLQNPNKYAGITNMTLPSDMVIISHTVTPECTSQEQCCARVSSIQAQHMTFSYDIGYHFLLGSDGNIYEGRPWDQTGAHTFGSNCKLGVAFIGNFMTKPPIEKQVDAAFKLFEALVSANLLTRNYTIFGQMDVASPATESPGKMLIEVMADWPHYRKEKQIVKRPCHQLATP